MNKWVVVIIVLAVLGFFSMIFAGIAALLASAPVESGNAAVIPIKGIIMADESYSSFGNIVASSTKVIENIDKADNNPNVKAIIFDINSPGGSAVASDEIAARISKLNKTTVAVIREEGASGAYWIASATDYIIANRMSITGSVGVIGSYLDISGFLDRYNITYQRLVAGSEKDIGSPLKNLTAEERGIMQEKLDKIHQIFIDEVAQNRLLTDEEIDEISTGVFFLGIEALDLGLVDELGDIDSAKQYLANTLNITISAFGYTEKKSFIDLLAEAFSQQSFFVGKGIGSAVFDRTGIINKIDIQT
ncbi:MAG: signal peptide peptidase SppA [Candidatus Woesearchaeota archaeon]|nr:signal peptide peptidase SppA [Candidatus Woesearchaeota archaeon]